MMSVFMGARQKQHRSIFRFSQSVVCSFCLHFVEAFDESKLLTGFSGRHFVTFIVSLDQSYSDTSAKLNDAALMMMEIAPLQHGQVP